MGAVGGAVDFSQVYRAQSAYQHALDAAMLAAARAKQTGSSDGEAVATARSYMRPVDKLHGTTSDLDFRITHGGSMMQGSGSVKVVTPFLSILGFDKMSFNVASSASFGVGIASQTKVELALMLDVTGSMRGQKIADLKLAAEDLVNIVLGDNSTASRARIGIAPFSNTVRLDSDIFRNVTGKETGGAVSYRGCVVERTGADAYTDAAPGPGRYLVPIEDRVPWAACDSSRDVATLTSNKEKLTRLIQSFEANGTTAGHLGTAWAWYLLSPNFAASFESSNRPASYDELRETSPTGDPKLRKIAVLMTDGEYNTQYAPSSSTTQARALCENMKRTGIEVFTIGFDLGGNATAIETLRGCATDPTKFYNTTTGEELRVAFRDIALQASPLRIVK